MSSRRRSIIKFLPEARNSSAFSVEIYIKDFTREIICESLKYFLRSNPHKNPRNTRRTRILVKDYSKDFYLDFEPVRRSIIKRSYRATYCCAFWYEIFVKDFVREIICKSLKYFLRSNILKKISSKDFLP